MTSTIGRKVDPKRIAKVVKHLPFPHHEPGGMSLWRKFALFGALPAVGVLTIKTLLDMTDSHHHEPQPFVAYEHLRIRNKRFPWGDGQRSLFHNPEVNPLPTGYEK